MKKVLCVVLVLSLVFLCACGGGKTPDETTVTEETTVEEQTTSEDIPSSAETAESTTAETQTTDAHSTEPATAPPVSERPTEKPTEPSTEPPTKAEPTVYTKAQTVELLKAAVNKTKGYKGDITVHHKEAFSELTVSNVYPGGELSTKFINFLTGLIIKPSEETYSFSGGTATTSEGEKTQLLLPKDAPFTLTDSGVKSAKIEQVDGMTHITLTLVAEECNSLSEKPKHNASAIGYLDIGDSFKLMKITAIQIKYPGSVIDAYIREDGYVSSVSHTVHMESHGEATYGLINGKADFKGSQTETWNINW